MQRTPTTQQDFLCLPVAAWLLRAGCPAHLTQTQPVGAAHPLEDWVVQHCDDAALCVIQRAARYTPEASSEGRGVSLLHECLCTMAQEDGAKLEVAVSSASSPEEGLDRLVVAVRLPAAFA